MLNPRPPRQPLPAKQIEREGGTEDAKALNHPKEPQRRSPVYGTKAAATPLHPAQRETKSARDKDAQIAPQTHRQTTAGTHRSEPSLRRNAAHRDTQTTRDRTPSDRERTAEATRQKTPRQSTNEPARPRAKPTDARRDTRQKEGTGTTEAKAETPDAQAKRPPTHKRQPQTPQQESSPGTGTDHATRTRNPGKPGLTDTPEEEASEADAARPNRHEKYRDSRKDSKTRRKQMVVNGNRLSAGKLPGELAAISGAEKRCVVPDYAEARQ
jgi:hypothetical protein